MGGINGLQRTLSGHKLLLLDTTAFSYRLSSHPRYASPAAVVLETIETGKVMGVTTTVTLAELLTLPAQSDHRRAMQE